MDTTQKIKNFIDSYKAKHGRRPSHRTLQKELGISSKGTIDYHLIKLGIVAEYGLKYCECGKPTVKRLKIKVGEHASTTVTLSLCEECAELEESLSKSSSYLYR